MNHANLNGLHVKKSGLVSFFAPFFVTLSEEEYAGLSSAIIDIKRIIENPIWRL